MVKLPLVGKTMRQVASLCGMPRGGGRFERMDIFFDDFHGSNKNGGGLDVQHWLCQYQW